MGKQFMAMHLMLVTLSVSFLLRFVPNVHISYPLTMANLAFLFAFICIILYYQALFYKEAFDFINRRKVQKERINHEIKIIQDFLDNKFKDSDSEKLRETIQSIENTLFHQKITKLYGKRIQKKLVWIKNHLKELQQQENIQELQNQKEELENQIKAIAELKMEETETAEEKRRKRKYDLDLDIKTVFLKEELSEGDIALLLEEGYRQVNQYSIIKAKIIQVFVKPPLNHSITHTFLVWEMQEVLKNLGVANIKEHRTIDADITFIHKNKYYAIEVETGTLLKKKQQLQDKISYLNTKYRDRWMFLVSNKNLLPKHKQYGRTTQRKQVCKYLEKWLKIATQENRV